MENELTTHRIPKGKTVLKLPIVEMIGGQFTENLTIDRR